jgi:DNA-binding protein HU-beta
MNKKDFVRKISEKASMTLKDSELFLNAFQSSIEEAMANGDDVRIASFGTFSTRQVADRKAWNIATKEMRVIPARTYPYFKFSPIIKNEIKKIALSDEA